LRPGPVAALPHNRSSLSKDLSASETALLVGHAVNSSAGLAERNMSWSR
jgi:hypothetical protein